MYRWVLDNRVSGLAQQIRQMLNESDVVLLWKPGNWSLPTQEVRDLLACLRAIEDPSDQVALVAALRSPAFACSDVDLLRWVEGDGRLDYEDPGDGADGPVRSPRRTWRSSTARACWCRQRR